MSILRNTYALLVRAGGLRVVMVVGLVSLAPFILAAATAATPQPVTHVHALVVHPDHDTLLAGTHSGLFRSRDAGVTWERVSPQGDLATGDVIALAMHPQAYDQLYAAGHDLGVWRSHDFGQTWQRSDQGLPAADVTALAVDPHKSTQLYAWVVGHDLYRSQDSGHAWQRIADGPDNPQVQSLASVNIPTGMGGIFIYAGTAAGVFRSPD